jgi:hypothetical protein
MFNIFFEIDKLKATLRAKGLEESHVDAIAQNAYNEIELSLKDKLNEAMDQAIADGVEKRSYEFINDLQPNPGAFILETKTGQEDFSSPPKPNLYNLLTNPKVSKDGTLYKVIPVGKKSNRPPIANNIFDAQKKIMAERHESAHQNYKKMSPAGSKVQFRTVTNKQDQNSQWMLPATDEDFSSTMHTINNDLQESYHSIIKQVIQSYEESF